MKPLQTESTSTWSTVAKPAAEKLVGELRGAGFSLRECRTVLELTDRVLNGGKPDFSTCKFCGCKPPLGTDTLAQRLAGELRGEFGGYAFAVIQAAMRVLNREGKVELGQGS